MGVLLLAGLVVLPAAVGAVSYYTVDDGIGFCPFDLTEYDHIVEFGGEDLRADGDRASATTGLYAAFITPGRYEVYLSSYDVYAGRENDIELAETWQASFLDDDGSVVAVTGATQDLPDSVIEVQTVTLTDRELVIPSTVTGVRGVHAAYPNMRTNDVIPVCVGLKEVGAPADIEDEGAESDTGKEIITIGGTSDVGTTNGGDTLVIGGADATSVSEDTDVAVAPVITAVPSGGAVVPAQTLSVAPETEGDADGQPMPIVTAAIDTEALPEEDADGTAESVDDSLLLAAGAGSSVDGIAMPLEVSGTAPLAIDSMVVTVDASARVLVSLETNIPATVRVAYAEEPLDPVLLSAHDGTVRYSFPGDEPLTAHSVSLSDLDRGARYYLVAVATTDVGREAHSDLYEVDIVPVTSGRCSYLADYLAPNKMNDPFEVRKLQSFLRVYERATIEVNGMYDEATEAAVRAFQMKYADSILAPWSIDEPTGNVYITTRRAINEMHCGNMVPLTMGELAILREATRSDVLVAVDAVPADEVASEPASHDDDVTMTPDEVPDRVVIGGEDDVTTPESATSSVEDLFSTALETLKDILEASSTGAVGTGTTAPLSSVRQDGGQSRGDAGSLLATDPGVQTIGIASGELTGRSALDVMKQMSLAGFAFINQHALPILVVLVILLVVQLLVLWRMPNRVPKLRDEL